MCSIGAVIVTYNRLDKLKTALQFYETQEYKLKYILVVDNYSTDGTTEFLKIWEKGSTEIEHRVLFLDHNTGGSGGFHEGLKAAKDMEADWIWVADDDAYPQKNCIKIFIEYLKANEGENLVALCAAVYTANKGLDTWHRRRFKKYYGIALGECRINAEEYVKSEFELDLFSYVGTVLKRSVLREVGLPKKEFFIAYDDSEHSIRMRKKGQVICLPKAYVIHDTLDTDCKVVTWKNYYGLRNKIYSYRMHFGKIQSGFQIIHYFIKNFRDPVMHKMTVRAIHAAIMGILGMDEIYKPGWKEM